MHPSERFRSHLDLWQTCMLTFENIGNLMRIQSNQCTVQYPVRNYHKEALSYFTV